MSEFSTQLQEYRITPYTLWAVFSRASETGLARGLPPVLHQLELANSRQDGWRQIQEVYKQSLLLAVSLVQVREMANALGLTLSSRGDGMLAFIDNGKGHCEMVISSEDTHSRAEKSLRKQYPCHAVLLSGLVRDFLNTWRSMERACQEQDFMSVRSDRRPENNGYRPVRLLLAKKNPSSDWISSS